MPKKNIHIEIEREEVISEEMVEVTEVEESRSERIGYWILAGFIFVLPFFFSPWAVVNFSSSKSLLLSVAVIVLSLFAVFEIFKSQVIRVYLHPVFVAAIIVPVVYLISSFFSVGKTASLIGHGNEYGTASFTILLFILLFLVCSYFKTKQKIFYAYLAFGLSFLIISIFHIARIFFGANFLSFGIFTDVTSNTIGKWNDLGVFSGAVLILALISLESLTLSKMFKYLLSVILGLSVLLLAFINFSIFEIGGVTVSIFALIGVISLFSFVYLVSNRRKRSATAEEARLGHFPTASLVVFIISVVLTLAIDPISSFTNSHFKIAQFDARPSWQATYAVAKGSLSQKPVLGAGPEQFNYEWLLHKPSVINYTDLWNTSFDYGVGYIPSSVVTTGIIGLLAWLVFLGLFVYVGMKVLFTKSKDPFSHYLALSSFCVAAFFWIVHVLYVPSIVTLVFAFIWTGLFFASALESGKLRIFTISLPENRGRNFIITLVLVFALLALLSWGYVLGKKAVASAYMSESAMAFNAANLNAIGKSEGYLSKAIALDNQSDYHRAAAQLELSRMQYLVSTESSISQQDFQAAFQQAFSNAIGQANAAKTLDPSDYQNDIMIGTVAETLVPYGTAGAYDNALAAYKDAQKLNPTNPLIELLMARLEADHKDTAAAETHINAALKLKNNYVDAIYLLAQLQQASGDAKAAIQSLQGAYSVDPNDVDLVYTLGQAFFAQKDYADSSAAFGRAVALAPKYSNAVYYFGLSLYLQGDSADALKAFQNLLLLNPDNKDVQAAVNRLNTGGNPAISSGDAVTSNASTASSTETTASTTKENQ